MEANSRPTLTLSASALQDASSTPRWRIWLIVSLLAILWHLLLLVQSPTWRISPATPPRIEVQPMRPQDLDAIKKQWKQREKSLLLNKDKEAPRAEEAPPDARYSSDRNIRVEKEQRARQTHVLPKPSTPDSTSKQNDSQPSRPRSQQQQRFAPPRDLSSLGVPLNLSAPRPAGPPAPSGITRRAEEGGDQAILDRRLPEGSENLLNAEESIYYSFYARLYQAIAPLWQSRINGVPRRSNLQPGDYVTQVEVILYKDGTLAEIRHVQDSGVPEFDQAVDHSWRRVERFPNPPQGLQDANGYIHTSWSFMVRVGDGGGGFQLMPPERVY